MRFNWARVFDSVLIGTVCLLALLVRKEALLSARLQAHLGSDRVTFATTNQHDPIYQPAAFSKSSRHRNAYASLCFGDTTIDGTLVLFTGLRSVAARADFVAMTHNLSATGLARLSRHGIRIVPVQPLHADRFYMTSKKSASIEERDAILWTKLRAWELTDYDKVIMMDADLLVLENVDELFLMPEVAASALIHVSEKISFFKSSEYGMVPGNKVNRQSREASLLEGWSGLNSGVTVLKPSNETFSKLLSELSIIPNRPCCPSQEFIYNFFEERKSYFRLPPVYNGRVISAAGAYSDESEAVASALKQHMKIYHFVGPKPWRKRDTGSAMNRLWWKHLDSLRKAEEKAGIPVPWK